MRGRRAARAATRLPGAVSSAKARNASRRAPRTAAGRACARREADRAVRPSSRDQLEYGHASLLLADGHAFSIRRPTYRGDLGVGHLHVDGFARLGRAPQRQAPIAAAAHQVLAAGLPGEAVNAIGVAAQHDRPRAFRTAAGEVPEHEVVARAGRQVAAVFAPSNQLNLAVIAAHLRVLARRAIPEMQGSVGHAACEISTIAAEVYRERGRRPFIASRFGTRFLDAVHSDLAIQGNPDINTRLVEGQRHGGARGRCECVYLFTRRAPETDYLARGDRQQVAVRRVLQGLHGTRAGPEAHQLARVLRIPYGHRAVLAGAREPPPVRLPRNDQRAQQVLADYLQLQRIRPGRDQRHLAFAAGHR